MMRRFLLLATLILPMFSAWAAADHFSTPLMVIRFNQPRVYYEQPLYGALTRAVQAKSDVRFNVINYYPPNPRLQRQAEANFRRVLGTMERMGVPKQRISIKNEAAADLNYSEVHIYVR